MQDHVFSEPHGIWKSLVQRLPRLRVQVRGFGWEMTSGYIFRMQHFLVRQRIHVSVSPRGCVRGMGTSDRSYRLLANRLVRQ